MSDDACIHCGMDPHMTPANKAALREAERYVAFVDAHKSTIDAISAVISENVTENRPGSAAQVYDWPESEAVVIVQQWDRLMQIMGER